MGVIEDITSKYNSTKEEYRHSIRLINMYWILIDNCDERIEICNEEIQLTEHYISQLSELYICSNSSDSCQYDDNSNISEELEDDDETFNNVIRDRNTAIHDRNIVKQEQIDALNELLKLYKKYTECRDFLMLF
jgi:hypothetical protein